MEEKLLIDAKTGPESGMHQKEHTFLTGESCPLHRHARSTETYIVLEGQGRISIGEETLDMKPGDHFIVPSGTAHKVENTGLLPLDFISSKNRPADFSDYHLA